MTPGPLRQALRFAASAATLSGCAPTPDQSTTLLAPEPGERHLRNIRQLTFGGNNAEAYFSPDGRRLIFQRQERADSGCDQQYVMNVDGSALRRVSNGLGRTTCGYFYDGGRRILYSSTFEQSPDCPPPPDRSQGYVWPLGRFEICRSASMKAVRYPATLPMRVDGPVPFGILAARHLQAVRRAGVLHLLH